MSAIEKIEGVERWLAQEVDAGDEAVSIHRDALREALADLRGGHVPHHEAFDIAVASGEVVFPIVALSVRSKP